MYRKRKPACTTKTPLARTTDARPIQIIVTPSSGNGQAMSTALELQNSLNARGHPTAFEEFSDLESLTRWAKADDARYSMLVCVGGDGTQSATALAAVRRSVPFLPVSHGFGNLFARAFGHTKNVQEALDLLTCGEVLDVDVGTRNGELFLCQQSYGLIAEVQEAVEAGAAAPRTRWQRWLAYYRAALQHFREAPPARLRVVVDGRLVAVDAALVIVANVKTYGAWLPLTPDASPVDGLFDVFVLRAGTRREVFGKLLRRHLRIPGGIDGTQLCRGQRVSVSGLRSKRDELELLPGALPLVVSRATAAKLRRHQARRRGEKPLLTRRVA
jgi:diacylglycerol kinase (ATP)